MLPHVIQFLNLGAGEVFIIILVIILFFGTKNLPELARGLGKGIREFREAAGNIQREIQAGANEMKKDIDLDKEIAELRDATNVMKSDIQQGLDNIDRQLKEEEKKDVADSSIEEKKNEENNFLPPEPPQTPESGDELPGSIRRG